MNDPIRFERRHAVLLYGVVAALAWGAFAFGGVYAWAYTPLAAGMAVLGLGGLLAGRTSGRPPLAAPAIALGVIAVAVALQLVPLPQPVLARVSPGTVAFLSHYDLSYLAAMEGDPQAETPSAPPKRPISIASKNTVVGLGLFVALALFSLGTARLLSITGAMPFVSALLWLGTALAVVGITQELLIAGVVAPRVYGFWKTQGGGSPFGPFVNRNHFAGWMTMALPLTLALFIDAFERAISAIGPGRHDLLGLTNSRAGGRIAMLAVANALMALALVMTRSRSGVGALALGSVILVWLLIRRGQRGSSRIVVAFALVAMVAVAVLGGGLDTAFGRFLRTSTRVGDNSSLGSVGGRIGAWHDAVQMFWGSPWTGHGLDSYGTGMIVYQTSALELHFNEAHNDYLQLAAEGGLLLGIPIVAALGVCVSGIRRRFREAPHTGTTYWLRVGAVVGLLSIAAQACFEFSLQMPGNAALFAVLLALALHQSPNLRQRA